MGMCVYVYIYVAYINIYVNIIYKYVINTYYISLIYTKI